jgi:prepilin-type N-terminal cleavage/methylation domain-containing protein
MHSLCQKRVTKSVSLNDFSEVKGMKNREEAGFSMVELLLVAVIIGIIAAIAVPALKKGIRAAQNGAVVSTMRTIASTQVNFYSANSRFGRLAEINDLTGRGIGRPLGSSQLERNEFTFDMVPASPTDTELREGYTITATRNPAAGAIIYQYEIDQSGVIRQILP